MIEFSGQFNNRVNAKLAEYQSRNTTKNLKKLATVFIVISAFLCIYGLACGLESYDDLFFFGIGVFGLVFWIIFPPLVKKTTKKMQDKLCKMSIMSNETTETYKFDEEKVFIFINQGDVYRSAIEAKYEYFSYVVEDEECYMLFISKMQCHIVFKDNLKKGSLREFEDILKRNFAENNYEKIAKNN